MSLSEKNRLFSDDLGRISMCIVDLIGQQKNVIGITDCPELSYEKDTRYLPIQNVEHFKITEMLTQKMHFCDFDKIKESFCKPIALSFESYIKNLSAGTYKGYKLPPPFPGNVFSNFAYSQISGIGVRIIREFNIRTATSELHRIWHSPRRKMETPYKNNTKENILCH